MRSLRAYATIPLRVLADLLLTCGSLLAIYWLATEYEFPRKLSAGTPAIEGYVQLLVILAGAYLWSAHTVRLYRARRAGSYAGLAFDLIKLHVHLALVTFAITFYFRGVSYSRQLVTTFLIVNPLVLFTHHWLWLARERWLFVRGRGTRSCLIVGRGKLAKSFADRLRRHPWTGLSVVGFVEVEGEEDGEGYVPGSQIVGKLGEIEELVENRRIQEVVVALPFRLMGVIGDIDQKLSRTAVGVRTVLDFAAFNTLSREVDEFDGVHVINLRGVRTYGVNAAVKRTLDVVCSAFLLLLLSPILITIALGILITSGRPILFRQQRVGLDGLVFDILKFRTMKTDAEMKSGPVFADTDDPRCTPLGKLLRRTSLDELPQLWNVIRGEMSLVGPRPERPVFIEQFRRTIPSYMLRHHMKAGLTGWAQIHGWRGKTSLHKRIQYDLYYLRNWSVWLDIKILLLTITRVWRNVVGDRSESTSA